MSGLVCRICGTTSDVTRDWRPNCRKVGGDVCGSCCLHCEDHIAWSGIWKCGYISEEQRKANAARRAEAAMNEEVLRISNAYNKQRKARAREWYIKQARMKKNRAS